MKYKKHVFVCTNQKPDGKKCCGEATGMALVDLFKKEIKDRNLQIDIRAQRAGCFDVCAHGPAVVVYPEGIFYGHVQPEDVNEIIESHLINDQPVERLKLPF
ncbi:MAG: (2Fe-2S) ferredoxin domain-containing protein [Cytophagaceae bacterium]